MQKNEKKYKRSRIEKKLERVREDDPKEAFQGVPPFGGSQTRIATKLNSTNLRTRFDE